MEERRRRSGYGEMGEGRRRSGYLVEIQEAASECRARELRGTATLDTGCGAGEAEQCTRRPPRPQHHRRRRRRRRFYSGHRVRLRTREEPRPASLISGLSCGTKDLGRAYLIIVYGHMGLSSFWVGALFRHEKNLVQEATFGPLVSTIRNHLVEAYSCRNHGSKELQNRRRRTEQSREEEKHATPDTSSSFRFHSVRSPLLRLRRRHRSWRPAPPRSSRIRRR
ncbi:hypothetical protein C2845_PM06G05640 [Panicum miliaceum]|uniref:Uncharacterized protein n=1 Tax=Panicum miliaceum TaxID=4540 RepID=A0A3L6RBR2_PANMI|nr:hypothetical protein C2845_PM06G05640 [Panicum miliaceum]